MRSLYCVISQIKSVIPRNTTEEYALICSLDDILSSVACSAPECMGIWWDETHDVLREYFLKDNDIKEDYRYEYGIKVFSIFTTLPEHEIRNMNENKPKR